MIKYSELVLNKDGAQMTYQELLSTNEWSEKREEIIARDSGRCSVCNLAPTGAPAHYDEKNKKYSYHTDDGSENTYYVKNKDGKMIENSEPRLIITDKHYHMQVHHKYYILNKLPWEYLNSALVTVCNWCHTELHKKESIKMYLNDFLDHFEELNSCTRCFGSGYLPEYSHFQGGVCFKCNGRRFTKTL